MQITFREDLGIFKLDTANISYINPNADSLTLEIATALGSLFFKYESVEALTEDYMKIHGDIQSNFTITGCTKGRLLQDDNQ